MTPEIPRRTHPTVPTLRAVLFDYGMVLTGPPRPAAWAQMKSLLHAEEEPFHAAYWLFRHAYDRGDITAQAYWHAVAAELGRGDAESEMSQLLAADTLLWTVPNTVMIAWTERLIAGGWRVGLLSNLGDDLENGVMRHCGWLENFHHRTFSHRLQIAKPELEIYRHAAEGLGVAPGEVLFIDDREVNIEAAKAAGMQAIRYDGVEMDFEQALRDAGFASLWAARQAV